MVPFVFWRRGLSKQPCGDQDEFVADQGTKVQHTMQHAHGNASVWRGGGLTECLEWWSLVGAGGEVWPAPAVVSAAGAATGRYVARLAPFDESHYILTKALYTAATDGASPVAVSGRWCIVRSYLMLRVQQSWRLCVDIHTLRCRLCLSAWLEPVLRVSCLDQG